MSAKQQPEPQNRVDELAGKIMELVARMRKLADVNGRLKSKVAVQQAEITELRRALAGSESIRAQASQRLQRLAKQLPDRP